MNMIDIKQSLFTEKSVTWELLNYRDEVKYLK